MFNSAHLMMWILVVRIKYIGKGSLINVIRYRVVFAHAHRNWNIRKISVDEDGILLACLQS